MLSDNSSSFSIIVPVYNGASVIERCLNSVLNQTYPNFELIIIDDGSKDDTGIVGQKYATKDSRIIYYKQENKGVSAARNQGLSIASNELILFVDADDFLSSDYLEQFCEQVKEIQENPDVLIIQNFKADLYATDGRVDSVVWCQFAYGKHTQEEMFSKMLQIKWTAYGVPFAKLFRLSIIKENQLSFVEGMSFKEDIVFLMEYLKYVSTIWITDISKYHYTIDGSKPSLTTVTASFDSEFLFFEYFRKLSNYYIQKFSLNHEVRNTLYHSVYASLFRCLNSCMYKYKIPMSQKQRLNKIRLLATNENVKNLKASGVIDSKMKLVAFTLLKFRLFRLYDSLNLYRFNKR